MTYIVTKTREKTSDGYYIYDFKNLPQGYIKIHGQFLKTDNEALSKAASILGSTKHKIVIKETKS